MLMQQFCIIEQKIFRPQKKITEEHLNLAKKFIVIKIFRLFPSSMTLAINSNVCESTSIAIDIYLFGQHKYRSVSQNISILSPYYASPKISFHVTQSFVCHHK